MYAPIEPPAAPVVVCGSRSRSAEVLMVCSVPPSLGWGAAVAAAGAAAPVVGAAGAAGAVVGATAGAVVFAQPAIARLATPATLPRSTWRRLSRRQVTRPQ